MDEWSSYKSETGWDANSPPPEEPGFVNGPGGNLHLDSGSPAIGAGETVPGVTTDFHGSPRSVPPSLGAYTYPAWPEIFRDDFESGNSDAWTIVVP